MDVATILRIKPALTECLREFDACMGRVANRSHLRNYFTVQRSNPDRKNIEPMADAAGVAPRTLQEFLGLLIFDEVAARDRRQRGVARRHAHRHGNGGNNPQRSIAQLRTAMRSLVPVWHARGRCSRPLAEAVAAQMTPTQERNANARASHRKQAIRRLRVIAFRLKDLPICRWSKK